MKSKSALNAILMSIVCVGACEAGLAGAAVKQGWYGEVEAGIGARLFNGNKSQELTMAQMASVVLVNRYDTEAVNNIGMLSSISGGYQVNLSKILWRIGFEGLAFRGGDERGVLHPNVNSPISEHDPLNFNYKVNSYSLLFKNEIEWKQVSACGELGSWNPVIGVSLGTAFNQLEGFSEIAQDESSGAPMPVPFQDHWRRSFAYGIDVGVIHPVMKHLRLGIRYSYLSAGKTELELIKTPPNEVTAGNLYGRDLKIHALTVSALFG